MPDKKHLVNFKYESVNNLSQWFPNFSVLCTFLTIWLKVVGLFNKPVYAVTYSGRYYRKG